MKQELFHKFNAWVAKRQSEIAAAERAANPSAQVLPTQEIRIPADEYSAAWLLLTRAVELIDGKANNTTTSPVAPASSVSATDRAITRIVEAVANGTRPFAFGVISAIATGIVTQAVLNSRQEPVRGVWNRATTPRQTEETDYFATHHNFSAIFRLTPTRPLPTSIFSST